MHDIVNINPTTFEYKKRVTSRSKDSKESTQVDVTSVNSISSESENVNIESIKSSNRDSEYLELAKIPQIMFTPGKRDMARYNSLLERNREPKNEISKLDKKFGACENII